MSVNFVAGVAALVACVGFWVALKPEVAGPVKAPGLVQAQDKPRNSVGEAEALNSLLNTKIKADANHLGADEIHSVMHSALVDAHIGWGTAAYDRCGEVSDIMRKRTGGNMIAEAVMTSQGGEMDPVILADLRVKLKACKVEIDKANAVAISRRAK
jgi:hypothetical protein